MMRFTSVVLACVLPLLLAKCSQGQADLLPAPQLLGVFPLGAQVAHTTEVRVSGENLEGAIELVFSHPGIHGKPKLEPSGREIRNVFDVAVADTVPSGAYDVRLRGKFGISNPRRFLVGTQSEAVLDKVSNQRSQANVIEVGQVVHAATMANSQAWFRFKADKRDKLFIGLAAPETRLEPVVTLCDSAGVSLVRGRGEPTSLEFVPPKEGDYFLGVNDLLFRGGSEFHFRLSLSTQPDDVVQSALMPLVAGTLAADERKLIVKQAETHGAVRQHDKVLRCPEEYVSLFPNFGQAETFVFDAQADQEVWLDVWSHRLGYSTDVAMTVERLEKAEDGSQRSVFVAEAGDLLVSPSASGFGLDSLDGSLRLVPEQSGTYRVSVRDVFNTGPASPRAAYRLRLRTPQPDFQLIAVPDQGPRARPIPSSVYLAPPTLRRGGVASLRVFVQRQDNFSGDIRLTASGLPSGVVCLGAIIGAGDECASLTLVANDDAPAWSGLIEIKGTALIEGREVTHTASAGSSIWSVKDTRQEPFRARFTDGIGLAVVAEEAPIILAPASSEVVEAKASDKIIIKMLVTRRSGYDSIVALRPFVLGDQDKSARSDHSVPAGVKEIDIELDLSKFSVQPGEHTFIFHGNAEKVAYRKNIELVAPAADELKRVEQDLSASRELEDRLKQMVASQRKESEKAQKESKDAAAIRMAQEKLKESESAFKAAQEQSQQLAKMKSEAEKYLKDLQKDAEPKDRTFIVFSKPIHLRILPNAHEK